MQEHVTLRKIWQDDDAVEMVVTVSDGTSLFSINVYCSHDHLTRMCKDLEVFRNQVHGGLYDLNLGAFGPEYAAGGFSMRMHFYNNSKLLLTCRMEGEYQEFGKNEVVSKDVLHLRSQPALLNRFFDELKALSRGTSEESILECV